MFARHYLEKSGDNFFTTTIETGKNVAFDWDGTPAGNTFESSRYYLFLPNKC